MPRIYIILLIFLLSTLQSVFAQPEKPTPEGLRTNGCGAQDGWSGRLVPDKTTIGQCNFKTACDNHDLCYSRCLPGGNLYGKVECNSDQASRQLRRKQCDGTLQTYILNTNPNRPVCAVYAAAYRWAVENFGSKNFKGATEDSTLNSDFSRFNTYLAQNPKIYTEAEVQGFIDALNNADYGGGASFYLKFDKFTMALEFGVVVNNKSTPLYAIKAKQ